MMTVRFMSLLISVIEFLPLLAGVIIAAVTIAKRGLAATFLLIGFALWLIETVCSIVYSDVLQKSIPIPSYVFLAVNAVAMTCLLLGVYLRHGRKNGGAGTIAGGGFGVPGAPGYGAPGYGAPVTPSPPTGTPPLRPPSPDQGPSSNQGPPPSHEPPVNPTPPGGWHPPTT